VKLRLHKNSLRLRLSQSEVAQFSKTGYVEETVEFGPGASLCFVLETSSKALGPNVRYQNGDLRIQVSSAQGRDWATSDAVGISGEMVLSNGKQLAILIEKDFKCLHGEEPDPDAFPNPLEVDTRR